MVLCLARSGSLGAPCRLNPARQWRVLSWSLGASSSVMKKTHKIGIVTALTILSGLVCFSILAILAAAPHGSYLPLAILFPYAFVARDLVGPDLGVIAAFLALAQFASYGVVLGQAWVHDRLRPVAARLAIAHSIAAVFSAVISIVS